SMGHGENITNTHGDLTQIGKAKITYAKPQDMNKKDNLKVDEIAGKYSSIKTAKYNLTKPKGQDNRKTAYFYENKKNSVSQQDAGFVKEAIEFFKQAFKKK